MTLRLQPVFTDLTKLSTASSDEIKAMWTIVTKAKDSIDYGYRLENLSWRLWYSSTVSHHNNNNTDPVVKSPSIQMDHSSIPAVPPYAALKSSGSQARVTVTKKVSSNQPVASGPSSSLKARVLDSFSHILEEIQEASHQKDSLQNSPVKPSGLPNLLGKSVSTASSMGRKVGYTSNAAVGVNRSNANNLKKHLLIKKAEVVEDERDDNATEVARNDRVTIGFVPVKFSRVSDPLPKQTTSTRSSSSNNSAHHPYATDLNAFSSIIHHPRYSNFKGASGSNKSFEISRNPILMELAKEKNACYEDSDAEGVVEGGTGQKERVNFFIFGSVDDSEYDNSDSESYDYVPQKAVNINSKNFSTAEPSPLRLCEESSLSFGTENNCSSASSNNCQASKACLSLLSHLLLNSSQVERKPCCSDTKLQPSSNDANGRDINMDPCSTQFVSNNVLPPAQSNNANNTVRYMGFELW